MERVYAEFVAGILDSVSLIEESLRYQNTLQNNRNMSRIFMTLSASALSSWLMRRKTKRPMADSARILTLWALPDDLWQRIERLLNRFDPPRPRGRKRASAMPILDGLIYHFRTGCQWNQFPEVYGDDSTIHRTFQRWVKIGLFEMI
jgi:hypothetical protein